VFFFGSLEIQKSTAPTGLLLRACFSPFPRRQ